VAGGRVRRGGGGWGKSHVVLFIEKVKILFNAQTINSVNQPLSIFYIN
jgi:hypothetical protein